jgi:uncharacterized protein YbjT (DUF2867 family)
MKGLVLGATGGTGRLIVRDALAKGHSVVVLVRSKTSADLPGVDIMIEGDARDEGTLIRALNGCDGVVNSFGTGLSPFREVKACSATGALVTAMTAQRRAPSGLHQRPGDRESQPWPRRLRVRPAVPAFAAQLCLQRQDGQEAAIRASSLNWVIVRLAMLTDDPARGSVRAVVDLTGVNGGKIARADVARFVLEQLNTWLRRAPVLLCEGCRKPSFNARAAGRPAHAAR